MIKRILINALALGAAWLLVPGITLATPFWTKGLWTLLGVAVIFGIVNAIVKPLFKALTGCIIMITFGLFLFIINAGMLLLVSWICEQIGWGFHVSGLLTACIGGVIVAIVSFLAAKFLDKKK